MLPTPVFLPGEFHGLYSQWIHKELDTTEGNDVEHLFMCLFAICIFSSVEYLFRYFTHFKVGVFIFLLLSIRVLYIFWIESWVSYMWFVSVFSWSVTFLFILLKVLIRAIVLILIRFNSFKFRFVLELGNVSVSFSELFWLFSVLFGFLYMC